MTCLHEVLCYSSDISYSGAKSSQCGEDWKGSATLQAACPDAIPGTFYKRQILFCPLNSKTDEQSWEAISQDLLICKKYNCLFSKGEINWDLYFPDYKQHAAFLLNSLQNAQMFQCQLCNLLKSLTEQGLIPLHKKKFVGSCSYLQITHR